MKSHRRLLMVAAPALAGLLSIAAMGLAATPGPPSAGAGLQTITGQVLNIEGDVYAVKDISGHEVLFHVTRETRVEGGLKPKVGDRIEAQVTPEGHAIVVALKLPDAGSLPAPKHKEGRP
jgi:hypothetical protein